MLPVMPAVFVHGNPETSVIWEQLLAHLTRRDVIVLSPPGFGAPVPDAFAATADSYMRWLIHELQSIPAPIDLVGHDWGGGHVVRVAMDRPDLIRSWASDALGCFDPEYEWHERARGWQTPVVGEGMVAMMTGAPLAVRKAQLESLGLGFAAERVAAAIDAEMGRCILALYRSAKQPAMRNWGQHLPNAAARPGLALVPTEDHYTGGEALASRSAARAGARIEPLAGRGHWWMCEEPALGARVLERFFATLS
jgi:pimeloyl-ACP methyl ester carboxylesterase